MPSVFVFLILPALADLYQVRLDLWKGSYGHWSKIFTDHIVLSPNKWHQRLKTAHIYQQHATFC